MEFKFAPLKKFKWTRKYEDGTEVMVGEYHPGMTYNCTKEPRHDALREVCKEWEAEGLIRVIPLVNEHFETVALEEEAPE